MLKFAIVAVIIVLIFYLAILYYKKFIEKEHFYDSLINFLQYVKNEISFNKTEINKLIKHGINNVALKNYLENYYIHKNVNENLKFLTEEENYNIKNFFKEFGNSDVETETAKINNFILKLNVKLKECKEQTTKNGKLGFKLIIAFGFIFIIIFL